MSARNCIVWFRALRVHDQDALLQALRSNPTKLYPVYTIDPHYAAKARVGIRRWIFLYGQYYFHIHASCFNRILFNHLVLSLYSLECLSDLDKSLRSMGSRLIVLRGDPQNLFPLLFKEWDIHAFYTMNEGWELPLDHSTPSLSSHCMNYEYLWLYFNVHIYVCFLLDMDTKTYSILRDNKLKTLAAEANVEFIMTGGHLLYSPKQVCKANKGKAPLTYQSYLNIISKLPPVPEPEPAPIHLPSVNDDDLPWKMLDISVAPSIGEESSYNDSIDVDRRRQLFERIAGPSGNFDVPHITELGFKSDLDPHLQSPHRGGETNALAKLDEFMALKKKVLTVSYFVLFTLCF